MRRSLTLSLVLLLILAPIPARAAGTTLPPPIESIQRLIDLGVIVGVFPKGEQTDINASGSLIRAELATTIVRAFGREEAAQASRADVPYVDVAAESWFTGYVAQAKGLAAEHNITLGVGEGRFDPTRSVTRVEALILPLKLIGRSPARSGPTWYGPWIDLAVQLGLVTVDEAASLEANPTQVATRGEAFVLMDRLFYARLLAGGRSVYTAYVDQTPPSIERLDSPAETGESVIRIYGTVQDDRKLAGLWLNGQPVELEQNMFDPPVTLAMGANQFVLRAVDIAGNETVKTVVVQRRAAIPTAIQANPFSVEAGTAYHVDPVVVGGDGKPLPGPFTIDGEALLGTYQAGFFTAGSRAGVDTLVLRSGNLSLNVLVTVLPAPPKRVVTREAAVGDLVPLNLGDEWGNPVAGVTWSAETPGAQVEGSFFEAAAPGRYTVVATRDGQRFTGVVIVDDRGAAGETMLVVAPIAKGVSFLGEVGWTDKAMGRGGIVLQAVDAEGRPVADPRVEIVVDVTGPGLKLEGGATRAYLHTGAKGEVWVEFTALPGGGGGTLRIRTVYAGSFKLKISGAEEVQVRP